MKKHCYHQQIIINKMKFALEYLSLHEILFSYNKLALTAIITLSKEFTLEVCKRIR